MSSIPEEFKQLRDLRENAAGDWYCNECAAYPNTLTFRECCDSCGSDDVEWHANEAIDELAAELEKWARSAPAGEDLDTVCSHWMGEEGKKAHQWLGDASPYKYSSQGGPSMKLLVAMRLGVVPSPLNRGWMTPMGVLAFPVEAQTPELASARACAVLEARAITREELTESC